MKNLSSIIIAAFFLIITVSPVIADLPDVTVLFFEMDFFYVDGDSIDANDLYGHDFNWHMGMTVSGSDVVSGPHIEFTSDDYIAYADPPTSFSAPSTYIWDYPNKSLDPSRALFIDATKYTAAAEDFLKL